MALTITPMADLGWTCPEFTLNTVFGEKKSLSMLTPKGHPFLVMFICNHCPYVKAIEDRLIQLTNDLQKISVPVIAICSNDATENSEDRLENLRQRAIEKKYPFTYLHDEEQYVAKLLGAVCTPDFFLFDKEHKLSYRGRLDDSWKDATKVTRQELLIAAQILSRQASATSSAELSNSAASTSSTTIGTTTNTNSIDFGFPIKPSMGCNIKWR